MHTPFPWLHHFLPTFLKHAAVNLLPGTSLLIACLLSHLSQAVMVGVRVLWTQQGWRCASESLKKVVIHHGQRSFPAILRLRCLLESPGEILNFRRSGLQTPPPSEIRISECKSQHQHCLISPRWFQQATKFGKHGARIPGTT